MEMLPLPRRDLYITRLCEKPTATKQSRISGSPRRFAARDNVWDGLTVNSMKILADANLSSVKGTAKVQKTITTKQNL
ncbi:MAG: hypothetical protein NPINA01_07660 [Nitrospinaceae bacterium]|nr:MAG: hypothetical protein NPINA01_07660 [Nitrospinaceae bacterium]